MKQFKMRNASQSTTTYVDLGNYKFTLDHKHVLKKDTSVNADFFRIGFVAREQLNLETCSNQCGVSRTETASWDTPVLFGQEDSYYVGKIDQILLVAATALLTAAKIDEIRLGILPSLASDDLSNVNADWLGTVFNEANSLKESLAPTAAA